MAVYQDFTRSLQMRKMTEIQILWMKKALICFQSKLCFFWRLYLSNVPLWCISSIFYLMKNRNVRSLIFTIHFVSKHRIAKSYIACAMAVICTVFNVIKETPNFISGFATNSQKKFGIVKNMNRERVLLYMLFHNERFTRKCNSI